MQRYWIADFVHACETPAGVVLLDLKRDRYLGVGLGESVLLGRYVEDWPPIRAHEALQACGSIEELCEALLADGILSQDGPASARRSSGSLDMGAEFVS